MRVLDLEKVENKIRLNRPRFDQKIIDLVHCLFKKYLNIFLVFLKLVNFNFSPYKKNSLIFNP